MRRNMKLTQKSFKRRKKSTLKNSYRNTIKADKQKLKENEKTIKAQEKLHSDKLIFVAYSIKDH